MARKTEYTDHGALCDLKSLPRIQERTELAPYLPPSVVDQVRAHLTQARRLLEDNGYGRPHASALVAKRERTRRAS